MPSAGGAAPQGAALTAGGGCLPGRAKWAWQPTCAGRTGATPSARRCVPALSLRPHRWRGRRTSMLRAGCPILVARVAAWRRTARFGRFHACGGTTGGAAGGLAALVPAYRTVESRERPRALLCPSRLHWAVESSAPRRALCVRCGARVGLAGVLERFPCAPVAALPVRAALVLRRRRFLAAIEAAAARVREQAMAAGRRATGATRRMECFQLSGCTSVRGCPVRRRSKEESSGS